MAKGKYDVVVVGSGAGGATAAYTLVNLGLNVILLEAGRMLNPAKDFMTHTWPWELPFRGQGKPGEYDGLWKINEYTAQLYTVGPGRCRRRACSHGASPTCSRATGTSTGPGA